MGAPDDRWSGLGSCSALPSPHPSWLQLRSGDRQGRTRGRRVFVVGIQQTLAWSWGGAKDDGVFLDAPPIQRPAIRRLLVGRNSTSRNGGVFPEGALHLNPVCKPLSEAFQDVASWLCCGSLALKIKILQRAILGISRNKNTFSQKKDDPRSTMFRASHPSLYSPFL